MTAVDVEVWTVVCRFRDLQPERAVAVLLGGVQIAVVRTHDDRLYAVGNRDPFSGAQVLSRGIVGSRGDRATLTSPLYKQVFDLATGRCTDDPSVGVPVHAVRRHGADVQVRGS